MILDGAAKATSTRALPAMIATRLLGRKRLRRVRPAALAVALVVQLGTALAGIEQNVEDRFAEAQAQPVSAAQWGSWVFVPIPVANPTIGNGLQVAALYLHPKTSQNPKAPSNTSGIGAMVTDGGSRLIGAFHDGSYADDRYRIGAFAGKGKFELTFYGIGDAGSNAAQPHPYEMKGTVAQVRGAAKLPGTEAWFVGLTYLYVDATLTVLTSQIVPPLPDLPLPLRNAGLGLNLTYDSRDSNYYPTQGQYFVASGMKFSSSWGGDSSFDKGDVVYNAYLPMSSSSVVALRIRLQATSDDTPFYQLATLDMRGFSRDRYRDNYSLSAAAEWRHRLAPRWGMAAFVEAGQVAPDPGALGSGRTITSYGGGIRWRASADRDLNVGVDVAISTDDRAVFIQIGERF